MTVRLHIEPEETVICALCRPDFSALLDGELDETRKQELEHHLATSSANCGCLDELHGMKEAGEAYRAQPRLDVPPAFSELVTSQARRRVRREQLVRRILPGLPLLLTVAVLALVLLPPRLGLRVAGEAESGGAADTRTLAARTFVFNEGKWIQWDYSDQPVLTMDPRGAAWADLVAQETGLEALAQLGEPVLFEVRGQWYQLGAGDVEVRE